MSPSGIFARMPRVSSLFGRIPSQNKIKGDQKVEDLFRFLESFASCFCRVFWAGGSGFCLEERDPVTIQRGASPLQGLSSPRPARPSPRRRPLKCPLLRAAPPKTTTSQAKLQEYIVHKPKVDQAHRFRRHHNAKSIPLTLETQSHRPLQSFDARMIAPARRACAAARTRLRCTPILPPRHRRRRPRPRPRPRCRCRLPPGDHTPTTPLPPWLTSTPPP